MSGKPGKRKAGTMADTAKRPCSGQTQHASDAKMDIILFNYVHLATSTSHIYFIPVTVFSEADHKFSSDYHGYDLYVETQRRDQAVVTRTAEKKLSDRKSGKKSHTPSGRMERNRADNFINRMDREWKCYEQPIYKLKDTSDYNIVSFYQVLLSQFWVY